MTNHASATTSADEIRAAQRHTWETFAPGWEKWDDVVQGSMRTVRDALVASLEIARTQNHLDVAAGTGEPGLTIAAMAPAGHVTLTDLSPAMLGAAQRRAAALGLSNVEIRACSADALPFEDETFDSVSCRFGFMFFPDIASAAAELVRVLRPGGRLATSVWAGPDANPWATIAGEAIATEVEVPPPPPGTPGMYRCAQPGMLAAELEAAGLTEVAEQAVKIELTTDTPEQYWQLVCDCTAPVVAVLSTLDEAARRRIGQAAIAKVRELSGNAPPRLEGTAICVAGRR